MLALMKKEIVKVKESDVLRDIKQYLDTMGIFYFRANNGGTYNAKSGGYFFRGKLGVPDLIVLKDKKTIGLELKAPGKVMSDAQNDFHDNMVEHGGWISICCSSVAELENDLREVGLI